MNWPLDVDKMNEAAALLLAHSDFTSFCKLHSDNKTNLCRVSHAAWKREHEDLLLFSITADRFLRNMVRAIVGTLVDVGRGKITVSDFPGLSTKRTDAAPEVPLRHKAFSCAA